MVELAELRAGYDGTTVCGPLTVSLRCGALLVLGPNGSGKTTLLRTVHGTVKPVAGRVSVTGARGLAAIVWDEPTLHPRLTVAEHWDYLRCVTADDAQELGALPLVVAGLADRLAGELSLGQRRRVAIALAAAVPGLLLLDEPTNGLDAEGCRWLAATVTHYVAHGGVAVIATNSTELPSYLSDLGAPVTPLYLGPSSAPRNGPPSGPQTVTGPRP